MVRTIGRAAAAMSNEAVLPSGRAAAPMVDRRVAAGIAVGLVAASIGALYSVFARWGSGHGLHLRVAFAHVEADYRQRAEPSEVLELVRALPAAGSTHPSSSTRESQP